jgi:hypothetical protein
MLPLSSFLHSSGPGAQARHHASLHHPSPSSVEVNDDSRRTTRAQNGIGMPRTSRACPPQTSLDTRRTATSRRSWTLPLLVEPQHTTSGALDTRATTNLARRRWRRRQDPVNAAADTEAMRRRPTPSDPAVTTRRTAWTC